MVILLFQFSIDLPFPVIKLLFSENPSLDQLFRLWSSFVLNYVN